MAISQSARTLGAALGGGLTVVLGLAGEIDIVAGNRSDTLSMASDIAIAATLLAIGWWLLYGYVRSQSQRAWARTLRVVGVLFIVAAATTTYGNIDGYLDYENWVLVAALYLAAGAGSLVVAGRHSAEHGAGRDG